MAAYDYKIGTTVGNMVTLLSLGIPGVMNDFTPFSVAISTGNGLSKGMGWPVCEWHFGFLTETQRDALKVYCPGQSAEVFIRTLDEDLDYVNYSAILIWPQSERRVVGDSNDVTLQFRKLVAQ